MRTTARDPKLLMGAMLAPPSSPQRILVRLRQQMEAAPKPNGSDMHVSSARSFSLNPQDIVAEHRGKWAKIWLKFAGRCRTPWRDTGNLETAFSWMPTKRKFTAKDVLQGGLCFKDRTGRGVCDFHPRWFAYLPESSRQEFAELLNRLELWGFGPSN